MPKRYLQNDGEHTMFVGSVMIPPGEGREVDEQFLPPVDDGDTSASAGSQDGSGATGAGEASEQLRALRASSVRDLVPQLEALSPEDLAALAELEQASETPRVTVLSAISKLQLDRAQAAAGGAPT